MVWFQDDCFPGEPIFVPHLGPRAQFRRIRVSFCQLSERAKGQLVPYSYSMQIHSLGLARAERLVTFHLASTVNTLQIDHSATTHETEPILCLM